MYIPAHFAQTSPEELHRIMREHPLGMLVNHGDVGLDADHIPFMFDPSTGAHGTLIAHVARANTLWQRCPTSTPVMVVFRGAQAYISPSWFPSKHETHHQVPTWNYKVVHAHGHITAHDDERFARRVVTQLTRRHEAPEPKPWKMGDSAPDYIKAMLANIVGIEVTITSLVGKVKLSQNRDERDRLGAADALDGEIAEIAKAIPGYLGEETCENPAIGLIANVYYGESMATVALRTHWPTFLLNAPNGQPRTP